MSDNEFAAACDSFDRLSNEAQEQLERGLIPNDFVGEAQDMLLDFIAPVQE